MPSYNSGSMRWNEKSHSSAGNYRRSGSQGHSSSVAANNSVDQKNVKNALDSSAGKASNRPRDWGYPNRHTSSTHYSVKKYSGGYHEAPKGKGKGRYYEQSSRYQQFPPAADTTDEQKRRESSDTSSAPMLSRHPVGQKQQKENLTPELDGQSSMKPNEAAGANGAKNNRNQNNHSSHSTQVVISDSTNLHLHAQQQHLQQQQQQQQQHALGKPHVGNKTPTVSFPNITEEWEHQTEAPSDSTLSSHQAVHPPSSGEYLTGASATRTHLLSITPLLQTEFPTGGGITMTAGPWGNASSVGGMTSVCTPLSGGNMNVTMFTQPTADNNNIGLLSLTGGPGAVGISDGGAVVNGAGIFTPTNATFDGPDGFFMPQGMRFDPKRMEEQKFLNQENAPTEEMDRDWDFDYSLYKQAMSTNPLSVGRMFVYNPISGTSELNTGSCNAAGYLTSTIGFHPWLGHRQELELRNAAPLRYRD